MTTKLIKKQKLKIKPLENNIIRVLEKQGKINKKLLEKPTKTWVSVEPKIINEVDKKDYSVITAPIDDTDNAGNIYKFLDKGTKVRYMQLTSNWESKTTPNSFISGDGAGRTTFIDMNNPKPGIEARNWSQLTVDNETPKFNKNVKKALISGLEKAW